jgi:DNA-binding NtrC family response regulator
VGISTDRVHSHLTNVLDLICREIPAARARLVIYDAQNRVLFEKGWPFGPESLKPGEAEFIRRALAEQRPLLATRPPSTDCLDGADDGAFESYLCLPFLIHQRPAGAVCLTRESSGAPFSSEDLEFLHFLCGPILSAIKERFADCLEPDESAGPGDSDPIIGESPAARSVRALIAKVKNNLAPVFICGESGTGKEIVARAIHGQGIRKKGPFVAVNCGAIPDHLLESELFGHARGAFTGALRDKAGLIEEAYGGTFFLDEIGDLSLPLQSKLLRLLQEREIRRIGETRTRPVDARFISATNKNIEEEIERGNFRLDLYYRLRILTIEVPPLRERREDLLLLINHFLDRYCREMKKERAHVSPQALELLMSYAWPGNVRELQNEIQRCLVLAAGDNLIRRDHLSGKINPSREASSPVSYNYFAAKAEFERRFLVQALDRFGRNKARTAMEIGLTRQGLFKLLKKHKLNDRG